MTQEEIINICVYVLRSECTFNDKDIVDYMRTYIDEHHLYGLRHYLYENESGSVDVVKNARMLYRRTYIDEGLTFDISDMDLNLFADDNYGTCITAILSVNQTLNGHLYYFYGDVALGRLLMAKLEEYGGKNIMNFAGIDERAVYYISEGDDKTIRSMDKDCYIWNHSMKSRYRIISVDENDI